jgi:ankyrin repeat protein
VTVVSPLHKPIGAAHPASSGFVDTSASSKANRQSMDDDSSGSMSRSMEDEESGDDDEEEFNEFDVDPSLLELHFAICRRDSASVVREIVEGRPELLLVPGKYYGYLPIHATVIDTNHPGQPELVRYLAEQCPASLLVASKEIDPDAGEWELNDRVLPIHLATWAKGPHQVEVVRCLAKACPESLGVTSGYGLLPVESALYVCATAAVVRELFRRLPDTVSEETKLGLLRFAISSPSNLTSWLPELLEIVDVLVADLPGSLRAKRSRCSLTLDDDLNHPLYGLHRPLQGSTALHVAVHRTTRENLPLDLVERLVGRMHPATLLERNAEGDLSLHIALFADYPYCVELIRILLQRCPESAHVAGADMILPLHTAVSMRTPLLVPSFVELAPACTWSIDSQGRTPMHAVAAIGISPCPGDVALLMERWPESLLRRDVNGDLPLHVAAAHVSFPSDLSEVQSMLNRYPGTIQIAGANGKIPLHFAVSANRPFLPLVELLVNRHPQSVKVRDSEGNLPLFLAVQNESQSISLPGDGTIHHSWIPLVQFLFERWPEALLEQGTGSKVPLHAAVAKKEISFRLIEFLVERCPESLQASDAGGNLPLHIAASQNDPIIELVEFLVERCPESLQASDAGGNLPLHLAVSKSKPSTELVKLLVERCPGSLLKGNAGGNLPVHIAVSNDHPSTELIKFLVERCPESLQERENSGSIPLFRAAENRNASLDLIHYLVGASPFLFRGGAV